MKRVRREGMVSMISQTEAEDSSLNFSMRGRREAEETMGVEERRRRSMRRRSFCSLFNDLKLSRASANSGPERFIR